MLISRCSFFSDSEKSGKWVKFGKIFCWEMSGSTSTSVVGGGGYGYGYRPPFTAVQWQELEHQAMIYKYLVAGLPVPPDLVVPIRRSFEAISARFFHHPSCMFLLSSSFATVFFSYVREELMVTSL